MYTLLNKKARGFTLIELLVVIAIIGILSSIVLASLNTARQKSRDARREAELKQIQNALELSNNTNNKYPIHTTATAVDSMGSDLVTPGYIAALPKDPSSGSYEYISTASGSNYCIAAGLEGTAPASACPAAVTTLPTGYGGGTNVYYVGQ